MQFDEWQAALAELMGKDDARLLVSIVQRDSDGFVLLNAIPMRKTLTREQIAKVLRHCADRIESGKAPLVSVGEDN